MIYSQEGRNHYKILSHQINQFVFAVWFESQCNIMKQIGFTLSFRVHLNRRERREDVVLTVFDKRAQSTQAPTEG